MKTLHEDRPIKCHKQRGRRGLDLLILNFGARWGWVVNITPRPFCARERTLVTITAQGLVWTGMETRKFLPYSVSNTEPSSLQRIATLNTTSGSSNVVYINYILHSRVLHIEKSSKCVCSVEHMKIKLCTDLIFSSIQSA